MKSKFSLYGDIMDHEKLGVNYLKEILPKENYFLMISYRIPTAQSSREVDSILVCPKGVYSVEMKHWYGEIREELNLSLMNCTLIDRKMRTTLSIRNPVNIADDQRKKIASYVKNNLEDEKLGHKLTSMGGVKGIVFFTDPSLKFRVARGCSIACLVPDTLEDYFSNGKDLLSEEEIKKIITIFGIGEDIAESNHFKEGEEIDSYIIERFIYETDMYQLYKARSSLIDDLYYFLKAVKINPMALEEEQGFTEEVGKRDTITKNVLKGKDYVHWSSNVPRRFGSYIISVNDWVEHVTLDEMFDRKIELKEKARIVSKLIEILRDMHKDNIYHRDLNPKNVIITHDKEIKLMNFDFAKLYNKPTVVNSLLKLSDVYKAPEIIFYDEHAQTAIDYRTDIYSFGILVYEFLAGERVVNTYGDKVSLVYSQISPKVINYKNTELNNALKNALSDDQDDRPRGFELLEDWINDYLKENI